MIVYISEELNYLKEQLIEKGYQVTTSSDDGLICDAVICNLKNGGLTSLNMQNNIKREGTLIIDIGSKNIDEIEYILNNRVYSAIFS